MFKSALLIFVISALSFAFANAQLSPGTESCYPAAVKVATDKIAKDSKTKGSVLNKIGFVADFCKYDFKSEMINCYKSANEIYFDVGLGSGNVLNYGSKFNEVVYQFNTGTQGVDVHYELHFLSSSVGTLCQYQRTSVWTDGYEESGLPTQKNEKTPEEIKMCVAECQVAFDRPGAEYKACVSRCYN